MDPILAWAVALMLSWAPPGRSKIKDAIETRVAAGRLTFALTLDAADGAGASWLHRHTEVLTKAMGDDGRLAMTVSADPAKADMIRRKFRNQIDHGWGSARPGAR